MISGLKFITYAQLWVEKKIIYIDDFFKKAGN